MNFWIIMDKDEGSWLPQHVKSGGMTWSEPAKNTVPPRLFRRERDAKSALTWWLKGTTHCAVNSPEGLWGEASEVWTTRDIPQRRNRNMVVTQIKITIASE